jgi:uncharacterized membrane protein YbhN (UPF0104 family)
MPPVARKTLSALLGVGAVGYLARVLWLKRDELGRTLDIGWGTTAVLVTLAALSHLQRSHEVNFMLRRLKVPEPIGEAYLLTGAAALLNYLPLGAGSVGRAVVARRRHALPYTSFVAALTVGAIVNASVAALCGLVASVQLAGTDAKMIPLVIGFGAITLGGLVAVSLPPSLAPRGPSFVARHLRTLAEGLVLIRDRGRGILVLALFSLCKLLLNGARLWLCFKALGVVLGPLTVTLVGSTAILASLVNLAPGNLGLRELLLGAIAAAGGGSATVGMAAASLERAVTFSWAVLSGIPCLLLLKRFGITAPLPLEDRAISTAETQRP